MDDVTIRITLSEEFTPTERLRAALERVARVCQRNEGTDTEDEVGGFGMSGLQIGSLDQRQGSSTSQWNDGCWGFDETGCGWFQHGEKSCIGLWFR
jgi:hypothetical protein